MLSKSQKESLEVIASYLTHSGKHGDPDEAIYHLEELIPGTPIPLHSDERREYLHRLSNGKAWLESGNFSEALSQVIQVLIELIKAE